LISFISQRIEPVLPEDWKNKIDLLLEYRSNCLRTKYGGNPISRKQTYNSREEIKYKTSTQEMVTSLELIDANLIGRTKKD